MNYSPLFEESLMSCCNDGEYSSMWTVMSLSTIIGLPIQTLYPAMNRPLDRAPEVLTKLLSPDTNKEPITILWSKMGPGQRPMWTANHFVPVFKHDTTEDRVENTEQFMPNYTSTLVTDRKRKATFLIKDNMGIDFMVTNSSRSNLDDDNTLNQFCTHQASKLSSSSQQENMKTPAVTHS
ncbi:hypothetical protein ACJMK2_043154 [Sinanodonta woodiana]|uniref:Uncharacterized protein n=1 Tax=Sinanodonta woodiana TaxID=1069815 RepID=A0ABD3VXS5_SINWO